jgi:MFS family permease
MEHNGAEFALTRTLQERRTSIVHGLKAHFSFATLLAILFLTFLDNTIASAVLTSVQAKLHAGVSQLQWVVGGYALAFASLMLICGSLGDNFGRKRVMLIGVAIFCCGSMVCAFAVWRSRRTVVVAFGLLVQLRLRRTRPHLGNDCAS